MSAVSAARLTSETLSRSSAESTTRPMSSKLSMLLAAPAPPAATPVTSMAPSPTPAPAGAAGGAGSGAPSPAPGTRLRTPSATFIIGRKPIRCVW